MAYYYKVCRTQSLVRAYKSSLAGRVFPPDFSLVEEDEDLLLEVISVSGSTDQEVFARVQSECDRIAFLTGEDLQPRFARKDNPDGSTTASDTRRARTAGYAPIPADLDRQSWSVELPVQLRLWQLAGQQNLPVAVRTVLLFQIIEISFPDTSPSKPGHQTKYPEYTDACIDPDPYTEAKILRHLASHGKKMMSSREVQLYCQRHGVPAQSNDPTNVALTQLFNSRLGFVANVAEKLIESAITRAAPTT